MIWATPNQALTTRKGGAAGTSSTSGAASFAASPRRTVSAAGRHVPNAGRTVTNTERTPAVTTSADHLGRSDETGYEAFVRASGLMDLLPPDEPWMWCDPGCASARGERCTCGYWEHDPDATVRRTD